jgi:hypothetical protein
MKLNVLDRSSKNSQLPNLMKIHPVGAKLFNADGYTDRGMDGPTKRLRIILTVIFPRVPRPPPPRPDQAHNNRCGPLL